MQSNTAATAVTDTIEQYHVDLAADDLLSRGIRPTIMKIQKAIGGERRALVGFLEDWARRLHCRIAGRSVEELVEAPDQAGQEKADLELMREADSIQKKALRSRQAHRQRTALETVERNETAMRQQELLIEIEKTEQKIRGSKARAEELRSRLQMSEANAAAAEMRLRNLKAAHQTLS